LKAEAQFYYLVKTRDGIGRKNQATGIRQSEGYHWFMVGRRPHQAVERPQTDGQRALAIPASTIRAGLSNDQLVATAMVGTTGREHALRRNIMGIAHIIDTVRTPPGIGKPGKGALAHLHPIGTTGSILIGTVLDELERRDIKAWADHYVRGRRHGARDNYRASLRSERLT
jgi:hypothetical protein